MNSLDMHLCFISSTTLVRAREIYLLEMTDRVCIGNGNVRERYYVKYLIIRQMHR